MNFNSLVQLKILNIIRTSGDFYSDVEDTRPGNTTRFVHNNNILCV